LSGIGKKADRILKFSNTGKMNAFPTKRKNTGDKITQSVKSSIDYPQDTISFLKCWIIPKKLNFRLKRLRIACPVPKEEAAIWRKTAPVCVLPLKSQFFPYFC